MTSAVAVVALLADACAERELRAGFEEEGVPLACSGEDGDALTLARRAARRSPLGAGIGADAGRLVLVLAAASGRPYLEARPGEARAFGRRAARVAAGRPV